MNVLGDNHVVDGLLAFLELGGLPLDRSFVQDVCCIGEPSWEEGILPTTQLGGNTLGTDHHFITSAGDFGWSVLQRLSKTK